MPFDFHSLLDIALRSSAVYVFMLVAFRIFGKRELSQLSIADLVLIVLISNAVQNAMVGDNTSLIGGLVAATTLFLLNLVLSFLMFKFKSLRVLVQSEPITLIFKGKVLEKNLKAVMISEEELLSAIREHGIENVADVSLSMLEPDGNISVISGNDTHLKRTQYKRKKHHKTLQDI
ncbi:MAG TPA: DUF421 domain-containing protein [Chitinophagales bacterium]|nr:DUF421 domain-containing protein [Chitinophagales bacterium]HMW12053.1 DUF421 domain-containing protein [Chitinophagales bacterium]HMX59472.1 DUF421 domain-containing protein [Chitinophagales bacterium]HMY23666.1 DUF421 domain-containing protein [Chitinophagales bacterium]HMZ32795.1 DUF421 domain-containing protein [Chitinophagales bacterium]